MTNDALPAHLEAIGRQLTAAAGDLACPPRRSRRRALRLAAVSTTGLAAIATAAVLAVGATTGAPPAFAVTRHHDGSVSVKINRRSGIGGANRKLAAMGIDERVMLVRVHKALPISCVASGPGQDRKSLIVKGSPTVVAGPTVATSPTSTPPSTTANPGAGGTGDMATTGTPGVTGPAIGSTWHVVACSVDGTGHTRSGDTASPGAG